MEDSSLWIQISEGNAEALSQLFLRHATSLFNYGILFCHDRQRVEDCLQDLFFNLWQKHRLLPKVANVKTYLIIALRNRILSSFRNQANFDSSDVIEAINVPDEEVEKWISNEIDESKTKLLYQVLESLPHRMKQVIYLRYFENLDYREIAKIMNIQKQVAINMVYRALTHLRTKSNKYVLH